MMIEERREEEGGEEKKYDVMRFSCPTSLFNGGAPVTSCSGWKDSQGNYHQHDEGFTQIQHRCSRPL